VADISKSDGGRISVIGIVLCLLAAVCCAAGVVCQKLALRHASAVQVTSSGCFTGTTTNFLMLSEPGSLRAAMPPSSGRPWIDHLYTGFKEILDVPRGQGCPASPADGCDLGVKTLDRQAQASTPDHHRAEPGGRWGIKWLNELTERGEQIRRGRQQAFFSPPVREAFDAMADLGDGDRRGAEFVGTPPANPVPHAGVRLWPHQL
jgi:hypothetical protein